MLTKLHYIYLPALEGHLSSEVLHTLHALLEFCYIAQKNCLTQTDLDQLKDVLSRLHQYQSVFPTCVDGVLHPRQHALLHYHSLIQLFGAPNGLCSSIWHHSNQNQPLGQILVKNQQIDQLTAAWTDFSNQGMLIADPVFGSYIYFLIIYDLIVNMIKLQYHLQL